MRVPAKRVIIIDDDQAVLDSLEAMLLGEGFAVETFASPEEFLDGYAAATDACLVTDVRMPRIDGLQLIQMLKERGPLPPVIVITGHGDVAMAVRAMKLGARDFVEKPFEPSVLTGAIETALGTVALPTRGADAEVIQRIGDLTPREREVFEQLVLGRSNKEIARALDISPRTVEIHRARVMEKMRAENLPKLVRMAFVAGIEPGLD